MEVVGALSAHADKKEMLDYFQKCGAKNIKHCFCVHGDDAVLEPFMGALSDIGIQKVSAPQPNEVFEIN